MPKSKAQHYEYKLPEDFELTEPFRLKLDSIVDETGLTNQQAQQFVDLHVEMTNDFVERFMAELASRHQTSKKGKYHPEGTVVDVESVPVYDKVTKKKQYKSKR